MRSSRVANIGGSEPFWYLTMSFGARQPTKYSILGAEGSDRISESVFEFSYLADFSLGGLGSGVGSAKGRLLRDSSSSDSSG